ncbi:MAG: hypothetical protein JRI59_04700 [Deltaproteobacteria bacterium]|nr:hypothetical protein [Deltaproteobacteria bacterium]
MESKHDFMRLLLLLTLAVLVAWVPLAPQPAQASYEDAAIFYDELSQYGSWVDYEDYGPVWYPSQVEEDWRPYTNGRWVPSEQGYLFETDEPWAWATYHYGNWMPTENYGWVWVPGRTWYPNTVAWRHSPEDTPDDLAYIGWAPIPPPNYVPPPGYGAPGYYGGSTVLDLIAAPFWIFVQATRFLLGFGMPYSPSYSYYGCGCLAPINYVPVIYPATVVVRTWYYPSYYPSYLLRGPAYGAYFWGPPVRYVSRVTRINYITINHYIRKVHIHHIRGGWPGRVIFRRNPHLWKIVPVKDPVRLSRLKPKRVFNVKIAAKHLGNPRAIVRPAGLRPLDRARLPKARAVAFTGKPRGKFRALELPRRAQQRLTPRQRERLQRLKPVAVKGPAGREAGKAVRGPGPWVTPKGAARMKPGRPEELSRQRGRRVGPGEGPETSQGLRRGPIRGFQGPPARGVRRGPAAVPETIRGMRRGPQAGVQGTQPQALRRGKVAPPAATQGLKGKPGKAAKPPEAAGFTRPGRARKQGIQPGWQWPG